VIEELSTAIGYDVPRETLARLETYAELLRSENERQNLIARSTVEQLWSRHILDSAQLLRHMPSGGRRIDLGSGAGLPGLVIAILSPAPITLVEPRRLRAEFLSGCAERLNLDNVVVVQAKAERVGGSYDVITARAVASVDHLFAAARHLSHPGTIWVLPKGRSGELELAQARQAWQGRFSLEPSITEGDAVIVVASGVTARAKGRA